VDVIDGAGMTVIERVALATPPRLSRTLKETGVAGVTAVGVPEISPEAGFKTRPDGREPEVMDQVKGDIPPETERERE